MNKPPDPKSTSAAIAASRSLDSARDAADGVPSNLAAATSVLTINLEAIVDNWKMLDKRAVPAECAAVVKADAYGCGAAQVTKALVAAGCKTFFVATLDEARTVRDAAPFAAIYVLDGFFSGTGDTFADIDCRPVIGDFNELVEWDAFRKTSGWSGDVAIHIDTGMNRLGMSAAEAQALIPRVQSGNHGISLVMSHLVNAESLSDPINGRQVGAFRDIASLFSGVPASLSNSSGIFLGSQFHFDLVRPGAALYGVNPTPEADTPVKPVVDFKARVVQLRNVERGDTVGYGATWTARRPTKLAIVAMGYADGYFRAGGGVDGVRSAEAIVGGHRCPLAGRVSMDLIAVDITDVPPGLIRRGHFVTMLGDGITVDELGQRFGTIGYEVLTNLGRRHTRVYRGATS